MILAIDPGTTQTALCQFDGIAPSSYSIAPNDSVADFVRRLSNFSGVRHVYCEMIASYGMPVGKEVFETCLFIGRLQEACARQAMPFTLVYRQAVKLHLCKSARAKDGNIRQSLIDRFGPPGTKKAQGRTYGMSADMWQAFALAVTAWDTLRNVSSAAA